MSPREVMAAPAFTSKRKSRSKAHARPGSIKIIPVKKELPDIDLSVPMPPPSPTDDPILLSGPFGPPASTPSRPQRSASVLTTTESIQTDVPVPESEDLPYYDWRSNTRPDNFNSSDSQSLMDVHPSDADVPLVELPAFNLDDLPPSSDAWSDSDDDVLNELGIGPEAIEEGEGEYTGKWRTLLVKTKQDPPSSITRARMEQWGRPVSPFPEEAKSFQIINEEEEPADGGFPLVLDLDQQDEIDEEEVRRISVEPEGEDDVPQSMLSNLQTSGRNEVSNAPSDEECSQPDATNPIPLVLHDTNWTSHRHLESDSRVRHELETVNNDMADDASDDNSSDQEAESSFVKITSADPRAAARAAAILKQVSHYRWICPSRFNFYASMIMIALRKLQSRSVSSQRQAGYPAVVPLWQEPWPEEACRKEGSRKTRPRSAPALGQVLSEVKFSYLVPPSLHYGTYWQRLKLKLVSLHLLQRTPTRRLFAPDHPWASLTCQWSVPWSIRKARDSGRRMTGNCLMHVSPMSASSLVADYT